MLADTPIFTHVVVAVLIAVVTVLTSKRIGVASIVRPVKQ
jgi:hypothetical protein